MFLGRPSQYLLLRDLILVFRKLLSPVVAQSPQSLKTLQVECDTIFAKLKQGFPAAALIPLLHVFLAHGTLELYFWGILPFFTLFCCAL
jgi:hypothetical protein